MPISVVIPSRDPLRVSVKFPPKINTTINKVILSNVNLEELKNVDTLPYGLSSGFTVVYNSTTNTWITQPLPEGLSGDVDGGLY